jgi:TRAP-type C4-dicarboxylate transport system substrate-binding protein
MKQKTAWILMGAMIAALCMAAFTTAGAAEDPVKLTYANFPPAPTFPCVQMERWKTEVEKRTSGKVLVNTFPGSTLLGAKDMIDGVIAGQADIGCASLAYQPGRFTLMLSTSLPLPIPDARTGSLMVWNLYNKYKPESLAKLKVLTMFISAPSNIMSSVPIRNLEDIKGLPLRASGGALEILKAWGSNPVGMPMSDTPEALQKGVVKGLFSSLEVLKDFKFAETCRYATLTNVAVYPFAVVMNMDKWNSLPKDVQKVMEDLGTEQSEWTGTYMDNHVTESVEWSKKTHNVEFIELSAEEKAKWDKLLEPITAEWVKNAKEKGLPAEDILKDIDELLKN